MKIQVTPEHIKDGQKCSCYNCPIALALRDQFAPGTYVSVCADSIQVDDLLYSVSRRIQVWIRRFDDGREVSPIEFEIDKNNFLHRYPNVPNNDKIQKSKSN